MIVCGYTLKLKCTAYVMSKMHLDHVQDMGCTHLAMVQKNAIAAACVLDVVNHLNITSCMFAVVATVYIGNVY